MVDRAGRIRGGFLICDRVARELPACRRHVTGPIPQDFLNTAFRGVSGGLSAVTSS